MKVTSVNIDPARTCGREKCLVTVSVHLAGLRESMTINVVVSSERDDGDVQECAIARAKDSATPTFPDKRTEEWPMPLKLLPTGLGSGIDKDHVDYTVFGGGWAIGRIYEPHGFPGRRALVLVALRRLERPT
jgi:hypothetical protein